MHTTSLGKGWLANHNGDYSGDVTFTKLPHHETTIPVSVVVAFVAEIVRAKEIECAENSTYSELLGVDLEGIEE